MAVVIVEMGAFGAIVETAISEPQIVDATSIGATQSITKAGAASTAFTNACALVEVDSDVAVRLQFGKNPDGLGTTVYLPALTPRQFGVQPGWKVIAI